MNTEELKLITDLLASLGNNGKEAFIWWLAVKYLAHYITVLLGIGIGGFIVVRVVAAFNGEQRLKEIRDLLRVGDSGWYSDAEHRAVMRKVAELMHK